MSRRRRAFILPVVLVVIGLLAVTMAGFVFFTRAEVAGVRAERDAQQAQLAAESGLQEVMAILRTSREDPSKWFDAPGRFRHALVWSEGYMRSEDPVRKMGSRKEVLTGRSAVPAWRYSVVAENLDGLPDTMRFGITPESGKLNLNAASDAEIERLLLDVLPGLGVENGPELVAALLDWMDEDDDIRPGGAESEYYETLLPGYRCKNGALDTLEELLLVKGFTAAVLYGEDTNRNGILNTNEDDGAASFPYYDNGDGILNRGLATYVTVWSREPKAAAGPGGSGPPGSGPPAPGGGGGGKDGLRQQSKEPGPESGGLEVGEPVGGDQPPEEGQPRTGGLEDGNQPGVGGQGSSGNYEVGRINVNTASARVLRALDGVAPEVADQVVALRAQQDPETLRSVDWLVSSGAMDGGTFAAIQNRLTTQAYQFHVEIVGYGDHTRVARRFEWIIEVRGPVMQVLYHRELTGLGLAWPLDDDTVIVRQQ